MTLALDIQTVPPTAPANQAMPPATSSSDDVPALEPLPRGGGTALVTTDAPKQRFWAAWLSPTLRQEDPHLAEAHRAYAQSSKLHEALAALHRQLPYDGTLLQTAPHRWEQLFTAYDAARASAIAALAGLKVRLDAAAQTGAKAALTHQSRSRFEETATNIRAADAECASLRPAARTRHSEASYAAAAAARVAAEKAAEVQTAGVTFRDDLKDVRGARRASLEDRLTKLWNVGYRFGYPFSEESPPAPGTWEAHTLGLAALEVIPALADKGRLVFGKIDANNRLFVDKVRKIGSVAELEEVVSSFMGKGDQPAD